MRLTNYLINQNFINVPKRDVPLISAGIILIELQGLLPSETLYKRRYSSDPKRIYLGSGYKKWVNANHQIGDELIIEIIDPNHIVLQ